MRPPHPNLESFYAAKIQSPENISVLCTQLKNEGLSIATLNGSFDLMHSGHLSILYEASLQADLLLVALNTDASIKRYKGQSRPIVPLQYRLEMMSSIAFVDYVTWFDEDTPCELLKELKPHVHVNGIEYGHDCIEAEVIKAYGGKLHLAPRIEGLATSTLIEKIQALSH